jgi:hypothetical protein
VRGRHPVHVAAGIAKDARAPRHPCGDGCGGRDAGPPRPYPTPGAGANPAGARGSRDGSSVTFLRGRGDEAEDARRLDAGEKKGSSPN